MIRKLDSQCAGLLGFAAALVALAVLTLDSAAAVAEQTADAPRDAQIMAVLDEYMNALNDLDLERHVATYHFPHFRHASGEIALWNTPEEAMPILAVPAADRKQALRGALGQEWDRSVWTRRDIVQADASKVHVVTRFARLRKDGSALAAFDSLYVLTLEEGRWAIKGRSSFAP